MRVSKERLSVIGRLIGIYREERRDNTQNEYTQKRFCDGICSPNTLKSIEAGGLSRSEDIYIELLDKLGLKYGEFPAIDEAIDEIVEEIYVAIEYYDRSRIEVLTDKAIRVLSKVKDYVYYSALYQILNDLLEYYTKDRLIEDESVCQYINVLQANITKVNDILRILLYAKIRVNCIGNKKEYSDVIDALKLNASNLPCLKINLIHYYLSCDRFLDMNNLVNELEVQFSKEKNYIRMLDVYNCNIVLSGCVNDDRLDEMISKAENLLNRFNIPEIKKCELYFNIASAYHIKRDYELALNYYEKMLKYYDENFLPGLLYMADCQNRLNQKIDIPKLSSEYLSEIPVEMRVMYKYFTLDSNVPNFIKQNYIMKKILPNLKDNFSIEIFRYELSNLVEKTGHYKNMLIFEKRILENTF